MQRRTWLIAALAAFFGLQMPVCALACAAPADGAPVHASPSCHETEPPSDQPTRGPDAPSSHEDCGCASYTEVAIGQVAPTPATTSVVVSRWLAAVHPQAFPGRPRIVAPNPAWPPHDILLFKKTLLI